MLDLPDQKQEPLVLVVQVLDLHFHFVDFGGFGIAFKFDDRLVLVVDFEIQLLNDTFESNDHGEVFYLDAVLVDEFLYFEGFFHVMVCYLSCMVGDYFGWKNFVNLPIALISFMFN